jgi:hypothetical protein
VPEHVRVTSPVIKTALRAQLPEGPGSKFTLGIALACSRLNIAGCWLVIASEDVVAAGQVPELVKRHEIAHCNGLAA